MSWHLVDSELKSFFEGSASLSLSLEGLPKIRAAMVAAVPDVPRSGPDYLVEERWTGSREGEGVRLLVVRQPEASSATGGFLHLHPGGWVLGSPEMSLHHLIDAVRTLGCVIVSVDYRLAPEHPFPAAAEDGWTALQWLTDNAGEFGIDLSRIGLMGESAGATLAAGLALRARDEGGAGLLLQSLYYPALDDRYAHRPPHPHAGKVGFGPASGLFAWTALLGGQAGADGVSPYAAPLRSQSFEGLPETFIGVGALDLFVEESLDFCRQLIEAGVPTELHVYPGCPHAFDRVPEADVSRRLRHDRLQFMQRRLGLLQ